MTSNNQTPQWISEAAKNVRKHWGTQLQGNCMTPSIESIILSHYQRADEWVDVRSGKLPEQGLEVPIEAVDGKRFFASRRGDWFESKSYGNLICLHITLPK